MRTEARKGSKERPAQGFLSLSGVARPVPYSRALWRAVRAGVARQVVQERHFPRG